MAVIGGVMDLALDNALGIQDMQQGDDKKTRGRDNTAAYSIVDHRCVKIHLRERL